MRVILLSLLFLVSLPSIANIEPRGIRNNNPANLVLTRINWKGEVKCADKRFECFETPYHGLRAMYKTLYSYYYKHNKRNVNDIIHRWSPPHENRTKRIVKVISGRLNCDPRSTIPISDMDYLVRLGSQLVLSENGKNPYSYKLHKGIVDNVFRRQTKKVLYNDHIVNRVDLQRRIRDYSRRLLGSRQPQGRFISLQEISCRPQLVQGDGSRGRRWEYGNENGISYENRRPLTYRSRVGEAWWNVVGTRGRRKSLFIYGVKHVIRNI